MIYIRWNNIFSVDETDTNDKKVFIYKKGLTARCWFSDGAETVWSNSL